MVSLLPDICWTWHSLEGSSSTFLEPRVPEDIQAGFSRYSLQRIDTADTTLEKNVGVVVSSKETALLVRELALHQAHLRDLPHNVDDQRCWEGDKVDWSMKWPWWKEVRDLYCSVPCDFLDDLELVLVRNEVRHLRAKSARQADRGASETTFQKPVSYMPPWEAFRLKGIYDHMFLMLASMTWEPGSQLLQHPHMVESCVKSMEFWLQCHEPLIHYEFRFVDGSLRGQPLQCFDDRTQGRCDFAKWEEICQKSDFAARERELQDAGEMKMYLSAMNVGLDSDEMALKKRQCETALWGAMADSSIEVIVPLGVKRRRLNCVRSKSKAEAVYFWDRTSNDTSWDFIALAKWDSSDLEASLAGCHLSIYTAK